MDQNLLDDVLILTKNVHTVSDSFYKVGLDLYKVDLKQYKDKDGNVMQFGDKWTKLRGTWRTLLRESQTTAVKTESYIQDFDQVIASIILEIETDEQLRDALAELSAFIDRKPPNGGDNNASEKEEKALAHWKAFVQLHSDLAVFTSKFGDFVDYQKTQVEPAEKEFLESIKSALGNLTNDMGYPMTQINLFRIIWLLINNEAKNIYDMLNFFQTSALKVIKVRIPNLTALYERFDEALAKYAAVG